MLWLFKDAYKGQLFKWGHGVILLNEVASGKASHSFIQITELLAPLISSLSSGWAPSRMSYTVELDLQI